MFFCHPQSLHESSYQSPQVFVQHTYTSLLVFKWDFLLLYFITLRFQPSCHLENLTSAMESILTSFWRTDKSLYSVYQNGEVYRSVHFTSSMQLTLCSWMIILDTYHHLLHTALGWCQASWDSTPLSTGINPRHFNSFNFLGFPAYTESPKTPVAMSLPTFTLNPALSGTYGHFSKWLEEHHNFLHIS